MSWARRARRAAERKWERRLRDHRLSLTLFAPPDASVSELEDWSRALERAHLEFCALCSGQGARAGVCAEHTCVGIDGITGLDELNFALARVEAVHRTHCASCADSFDLAWELQQNEDDVIVIALSHDCEKIPDELARRL